MKIRRAIRSKNLRAITNALAVVELTEENNELAKSSIVR
jgi:hypothetical protein